MKPSMLHYDCSNQADTSRELSLRLGSVSRVRQPKVYVLRRSCDYCRDIASDPSPCAAGHDAVLLESSSACEI